jgi:hypothetical protein
LLKVKIPDKYYQKKIENIKIDKCEVDKSCIWSGTLLEYSSHFNTHFIVKNIKPKQKKQNDLIHLVEKEEGYLSSSSSFASNSSLASLSLADNKCIFANIGCKFDSDASNLIVHMQMSNVYHLELMNKYFSSLLCQINENETTKPGHSLNEELKTKLNLTYEQELLTTSQDLTDQFG